LLESVNLENLKKDRDEIWDSKFFLKTIVQNEFKLGKPLEPQKMDGEDSEHFLLTKSKY